MDDPGTNPDARIDGAPRTMTLGMAVTLTKDERTYHGRIQAFHPRNPGRIYVRWHKGYASWCDAADLGEP